MTLSKVNLFPIFFSIAIFLLFTLNVAKLPASDNDMSRLAGIVAVAQLNKLSINGTPYEKVGDRIVYEGVSYSSKPPMLHVLSGYLVKTIFTATKPVILNNYSAIYRTSTVLVNAIPLSLIFFMFFHSLKKYLQLDDPKAYFFSTFLIFGTLLFTYSQYLSNHIIETFLQLALFILLIKYTPSKFINALIGILLSALFAVDITNGVIAVPITGLWLIFTKKINLNDIFWIFFASLPILFTHFYLSYIQFETFIPPQLIPEIYLSYEGSKWVGNLQGFEALDHPLIIRFFNYTFGTHGLFLYQPILLIPLFFKKNWRDPLWIYTALTVLGFILFNTIMQKNYAGSAFGPRRFLPIIPLIYFFTIKNLNEYWSRFSQLKKALVGIAFILTMAISLLGFKNPWNNSYVEINSQKIYFPILYTLKN